METPQLRKAAREYLERRVGIYGMNVELLLYMLEDPELKDFKSLLESGRAQEADSSEVMSMYHKKQASLREKAIVLADICGLTFQDDRDCFIIETISRRHRFEAIDKTDIEKIRAYLDKVKSSMKVQTALQELGFSPDLLDFETIYESTDWED